MLGALVVVGRGGVEGGGVGMEGGGGFSTSLVGSHLEVGGEGPQQLPGIMYEARTRSSRAILLGPCLARTHSASRYNR